MIVKAFSVYDDKAKAYFPPFFMPQEGQAIRVFKDMCNNEEHQYFRNPEDFTLFCIGTFDDEKGSITNITNQSLGNGIEFKKVPDLLGNMVDIKV